MFRETPALPAPGVGSRAVSACSISFGFGKQVSLAWLEVYSNHFISLAPPELIGQREERVRIPSSRAWSKARFTALSRTRLALLGRRRVEAGPGPMGTVPSLKSPTHPLPDSPMEAADNEKVDGGSASLHGVGLPPGVEWKCRAEVRLEEVWFCRAGTQAG